MDEQRTGRVHLNPVSVVAALRLPEGTVLRSVIPSYDPLGVDLIVEHPDFDPVPPDCMSPMVGTRTTIDRGVLTATEWVDGPSYMIVMDEPLQESPEPQYVQAAVIAREKGSDELTVFALDHARLDIRSDRPIETELVLHGTLDPNSSSASRAVLSLRRCNDDLLRAETSYVREVLSAMIRFVKKGTI